MKRVVRGITKPQPKAPEPPKPQAGHVPEPGRVLRRQISIDENGEVNIPIINEERLLRALDNVTQRVRQRSPQVGRHRRNAIVQLQHVDLTEAELRAVASANEDEVNINVRAELDRRFATGTTVTGRIIRDTRREWSIRPGYGTALRDACMEIVQGHHYATTGGSMPRPDPQWPTFGLMVRILFPSAYDEFASMVPRDALLYTLTLTRTPPMPSIERLPDELSPEDTEHYAEMLTTLIVGWLDHDPGCLDNQ
jgi:hypothetical protein